MVGVVVCFGMAVGLDFVVVTDAFVCSFDMGILFSGWIILVVVGLHILGSMVGHVFKPWPSMAG